MIGDLLTELFAGPALRQIEIDWFIRQGVPVLALAKPMALGTDDVVISGSRFEFARYRPSDEAESAVIIPGFDLDGELVDVLAWRPKAGALASWLGKIGLLGEEQVFGPRFGEPLMVHETPLEWLRAERQGVVVVDRVRAAPLLREAGPLATVSVEHGQRLRKMLAIAAPRVLVAVAEHHREAA